MIWKISDSLKGQKHSFAIPLSLTDNSSQREYEENSFNHVVSKKKSLYEKTGIGFQPISSTLLHS